MEASSRPLFVFFKNALDELKTSTLQVSYIYIWIALNLAYSINKLYETLDY